MFVDALAMSWRAIRSRGKRGYACADNSRCFSKLYGDGKLITFLTQFSFAGLLQYRPDYLR